MKSAGYSHKNIVNPMTDSREDSKIYPSFSVPHHAMPHMKDHKVGDVGQMTIKYKVTGSHAYRNGDGETNVDITHYEPATRVKGKSDKEQTAAAQADEDKQPKAEQK